MAKLIALPHQDVISGFKGVVDFYINHQTCDPELSGKGIPCARRWPRSPGPRRAAAVEAQWPAFSYISKVWNSLPGYVQDTYRKLEGSSGLNGRDMFTRAYLSGLYRYPTGP